MYLTRILGKTFVMNIHNVFYYTQDWTSIASFYDIHFSWKQRILVP